MARQNVPYIKAVVNGLMFVPAPYTVKPEDGHIIKANGNTDRGCIVVTNDGDAPAEMIIRRGQFPSQNGDLVLSVPDGTKQVLVLDGGMYCQFDGSILVDFEVGYVGTILAWQLPAV